MPYRLILIIAVPLLFIGYFTNPAIEKHYLNYEVLFFEAMTENTPNGFLVLEEGLEHVHSSRMKFKDYHLFSISYVKSNRTKKIRIIGWGLFEQVIPLSSSEGLSHYIYRNKRLAGTLTHYKRKGEDSPFGWRLVINPKALEWLGIN